MKSKFLSGIFALLFGIYSLSLVFAVPYYNWDYIKDNGFMKWLFVGELIATGKAVAWPYFYFFDNNKSSKKNDFGKDNEEHFNKAIEYSNEATKLNNHWLLFSSINNKETKEIIDLESKALKEAELVNAEKLNKEYPKLGDHFKNEYIKGLQLFIYGYDKHQEQDFNQGQALLQKWEDWGIVNIENMNTGNKPEVQTASADTTNIPDAPEFNVNELSRFSRIMGKANREPLTQRDLSELRSVLIGYKNRTGIGITKEQYHFLTTQNDLINDYMYQLGISLLESWDQRKIITTDKFDDLLKIVRADTLRSEKELYRDMECLEAAAKNQPYVEDPNGQQYRFSRKDIINEMKQQKILYSNTKKIDSVLREFINR